MIFVTVGSSQFPFDRLLHALDGLGDGEELVVQHGPSAVRPKGARCVAFMSFREVADNVRQARVVVSHGGIGSVLVALAERKRPVAVPRLARFGETADDHQLESVQSLARAGLVTPVYDPDGLPAVIAANDDASPALSNGEGSLVHELRDYIRACAGPPPREADL